MNHGGLLMFLLRILIARKVTFRVLSRLRDLTSDRWFTVLFHTQHYLHVLVTELILCM